MSLRVAASWITSSPRCINASKLRVGEPSSSKSISYLQTLLAADKAANPPDASSHAPPTPESPRTLLEMLRDSSPDPGPSSLTNSEKKPKRRAHVAKPIPVKHKTKLTSMDALRQKLNKIADGTIPAELQKKPRHSSRKADGAEQGKKFAQGGAALRPRHSSHSQKADGEEQRKKFSQDEATLRPRHSSHSQKADVEEQRKKFAQDETTLRPRHSSRLQKADGEEQRNKVVQGVAALGSGLAAESWGKEPWHAVLAEATSTGTGSNIDRPFPPHAPPLATLREGKTLEETGSVLLDVAPVSEHHPVSTLSHGLDRVLFNPGVHWLQDPRSHVYNFTPWLEKIPKVNDFAFERLTGFISSSRDQDLRIMATQENKRFAGSTSSLSGMLSHIYFLLTEYKEIDASILSQHFQHEPTSFTPGQRMPAMVTLNYKDEIYAIDSQSTEWDDPDRNVLTWMGTLLENFVTKSPEEFNAFMRSESAPVQNEKPPMREAYRYAKSDKFVMRSQLDCIDPRLPGTGVFDIKTRACVSIRMDILNYEENAGYMIKKQHGVLESFEREYYDLIRSAFLKYSFQVRIGNMDGVLVAYHNTERIFGFQYISLDEMDERLLGSTPGVGNKLFNHSVKLLEAILEEVATCFPDQSANCVFETPQPGRVLEVYVQPTEWTGEDEKPIKKLHVTVKHELNGEPARPNAALGATEARWDINYKIERVGLTDDEIRSDYHYMLKRKKRTMSLPSSVALEDAEEYWANLSFSKTGSAEPKAFNPDSFVLAQESVEKYRRLARAGRIEMQEKEKLLAGQPKIVYGQGVYEPEDSPFFQVPSTEKPQETPAELSENPSTEKSQDSSAQRPVEESAETK